MDSIIAVPADGEIHGLEQDCSNVCKHVLYGITALDALVAEEIGETCDRGKGCHGEADSKQVAGRSCPARILIAKEDDVRHEYADEADNRERNEHWMDRVSADLGGAVRVVVAAFVDTCHGLLSLCPNL